MSKSAPSLSREEVARREIGRTEITRGQAGVLVLIFIAVLVLVPLQRNGRDLRDPALRPLPSLEIFTSFPAVREAYRNRPADGFMSRVFNANRTMLKRINEYETLLKEDSVLAQALIPPTQALTTRFLGLGNERAYPGKNGWAFFRDGVDSLTGPGFLDPAQLKRRAAGGSEWQPAPAPDPRPAVLAFHEYLKTRNIQLVLMPAPIKPTLHPDRLSGRYRPDDPLVQNPSFAEFVEELTQQGISVFDAGPLLQQQRDQTGSAPFLESDTHWTPAAMEHTAKALAATLQTYLTPRDTQTPAYASLDEQEISNLGDIAENLLRLKGRGLYPEQAVTIHPVKLQSGQPWQADPAAEVLLMGDSFANIFSEPNMNWGEGAGLAEHLSHALQAPVDVIIRNDAGAHATRQALAAALPKEDRLHGKKVVIWEFAMRELAVGDWKPIDWSRIQPGPPPEQSTATATAKTLTGIIQQVTAPPRPGTVAYKDCIIQVHLKVKNGEPNEPAVVLNVWGMKDNVWTPAARWKVGQELTVPLQDWEGVSKARKLNRIKNIPLDDPDFELIDLPVYWTE